MPKFECDLLKSKQRLLDSKQGRAREPASFLRESVIAVVILPRVLAAGASSQMSEVLSFCFRERAEPPSIKISVLTFLVEKKPVKISRVSIF